MKSYKRSTHIARGHFLVKFLASMWDQHESTLCVGSHFLYFIIIIPNYSLGVLVRSLTPNTRPVHIERLMQFSNVYIGLQTLRLC